MFDMNKMDDLLTKIKNLFVSHTSNADIHTSATEKAKLAGIANNANNYSLPSATQNNLGGVKTGYAINGKNYPILVDTSSNAYVNVPWTDTNTWRGIQDNVTSSSVTESLSANQGKKLKELIDGKASSSHTHNTLSVQSDNYKQGTDLPSTYPRGETVFFSNNPTNQFNGLKYCTVHTIKGFPSVACMQYIYPYNTNSGSVYYRQGIYNSDTWIGWKEISVQGHKHIKSEITDFPASLPASDVYAWAKSSSKPTYTYSEVGAAASLHTHNYAGSSSVGGAANSLYYFQNTSKSEIGIDDVTANGIGYVSGTSGIFGQGDGAIYKQTYSSSLSHQIYGDYRTGQIAVRGKNNGTWESWRRIFDSSNYTSYVPTKTGSGASGSWGISITGSSASCTGNSATATSSTKATQDESGNNIQSSYASSLSASGSTLTLNSKSGATLSTVTISTQTVGYPTFVSNTKPTTATANSCFIKLNI